MQDDDPHQKKKKGSLFTSVRPRRRSCCFHVNRQWCHSFDSMHINMTTLLPHPFRGFCLIPNVQTPPLPTSLSPTEANKLISASLNTCIVIMPFPTSAACISVHIANGTWHNARVNFRAKLQNLHRHCFLGGIWREQCYCLHNHSHWSEGNKIFSTSSMAFNQ